MGLRDGPTLRPQQGGATLQATKDARQMAA
jgi:hypothetical protein